jgi:hypothetical protein
VSKEFFPPRPASQPTIYAYQDSNPQYAGQLKVGYTTRTARERLDEGYEQQIDELVCRLCGTEALPE